MSNEEEVRKRRNRLQEQNRCLKHFVLQQEVRSHGKTRKRTQTDKSVDESVTL